MKDEFEYFTDDFKLKYSESELTEVEKLIEEALESDKSKSICNGGLWSLSLDIEKHHQLQYTYHINLSKETDKYDEEVNLSFENGINDGTRIIEYSLDGSAASNAQNVINVLSGLSVNWAMYGDITEQRRRLIQYFLDASRDEILDIYSKQNYDNYATGGGTVKTNQHYSDKFKKFIDRGIHWVCEYKEVEVDRNFI